MGSAMAVRVWATVLAALAGVAVAAGAPSAAAGHEGELVGGAIGFATLGRLSYAFDVYTVALPGGDGGEGTLRETRLTGGQSVSYNAQLVEGARGSAALERLRRDGGDGDSEETELLVFVSEVEGSAQLYLDLPLQGEGWTFGLASRLSDRLKFADVFTIITQRWVLQLAERVM